MKNVKGLPGSFENLMQFGISLANFHEIRQYSCRYV